MSESDPSGYGDSPDTTDPDGTAAATGTEQGADASLTTDDSAQREDTLERPGNEPD